MHKPHPQMKTQAGFSLAELLIVASVMLVLTGAIFTFMKDGFKVANSTYELTEAQESLRTAQEYISRDLLIVGDGLKSMSSIRLPQTFVQSYLALSPVTNSADPGYVNLSIITSDNNVSGSTAATGSSPAVNVRANTDRITLMMVDSSFAPVSLPSNAITPSGSNVSITPPDVSRFQIGEIYFITSSVGGAFGVITNITGENGNNPNLIFAASDPLGLNQPGNGGPINVVSGGGTLATSLMRMKIINYYVDADGLLVRRVFGTKGATFRDSVVAEHVKDLQFRYALDLPGANGVAQQPVSQLTTAPQQTAVRQVESVVTTETAHPINNSARQSITMTTSTSVRNMQFRQATQPTSTNYGN